MTATLIIVPTEAESGLLKEVLGSGDGCRLQDFPVIRGNVGAGNAVLVQCGPGMANAAAATALAIERFHPGHVYHVGVCGVYAGSDMPISGVVAGTAAVFADTGVDTGEGFLMMRALNLPLAPEGSAPVLYNRIPLDERRIAADVRRAVFLTVAAASGSPGRARRVSARLVPEPGEVLCEDMESAAVALVAARAAVPCTVLRGISNHCGERDHARWKMSEAALAAQEELVRCLQPFGRT
jgi:futalosine hydrolase